MIAEGWQVAREGGRVVTRVSVKTADGRDVAEFTGYSRTLGGTAVDDEQRITGHSGAVPRSGEPMLSHSRQTRMLAQCLCRWNEKGVG